MKGKKPVRYIKCPQCKGTDLHYLNDVDKYRCNACNATTKG